MDFIQICTREVKGVIEVYPDLIVGRSKDLMVRGGAFYAIHDEETGLWSTDEYDVQRLVDKELDAFAAKQRANGVSCTVKHFRSFTSNGWNQFRKFLKNISDNSHQLDQTITFADTVVKKTDYVSRRLPYSMAPGEHGSWDRLLEKLYAPDERAKIEWTIGAIISGESKKLQKFLVLYGPGGTGKSTVLNIVQKLFEGYITTFEAKALVGNNNSFATEAFKHNPLVAIQHDGDLSKIEDNTKLNSIISHEDMLINEKYKAGYTTRINAMLLMGTNKPVRITDAKSGIIRRLIDAHPTGSLFAPNEYHVHMSKIDFELGAIAHHCLEVFRSMGKNYYNGYRPIEMMLQTDVFFNFIEAHYDIFKEQDGATLKQAYALYKEFVNETGVEWKLPQYKFREELRNYFDRFEDRVVIDGTTFRSYYSGFTAQPFKAPKEKKAKHISLALDETVSLLDQELSSQPAQYGKEDDTPQKYWSDAPRMIGGEMRTPKPRQVVSTVLSDLDTSKVHFVKVPENHIVIDFDLKDDHGEKSLERNLEAASGWPATYAELSKSGSGVHLHYIYTGGDPGELAREYAPGIEIKVYTGDSSLRRRLSKCNNVPVATISSGLPLKEKKKMLDIETIKSEVGLRKLITRNLSKEFGGTKSSIDFIKKILDEAYASGLQYNVEDMRGTLIAFANNSTNWPKECKDVVRKMKFKGDAVPQGNIDEPKKNSDKPIVFFDVEVYPNLFVVCWKYQGSPTVTSMINPTAREIEAILQYNLIGFNNRKYDNHILWARMMGYTNEQLYKLSQKIINSTSGGLFGEAYKLSYTDIYDFSSVKMGLKKFQIALGLKHNEMDIPWDQPVPENRVLDVCQYCCDDVVSAEQVFDARKGDFMAREILADLSGLTVNDTTQMHAAKIIFGNDRRPQEKFKYTYLSQEFPGYKHDKGVSTYKGFITGEGGFVFARPGMYFNVAVLDVASMHPTSIIMLNLFGDDYTPRFAALKNARLAIKHENWDAAKEMLDGKLAKHIEEIEAIQDQKEREVAAKTLSDALKIAINIVYGLTSASFENPFRDTRNKDNIVAKRGALFMIDLLEAVQAKGFDVVHIKTDSIKIPEATPEIIEFVKEFGKKYGYEFEHETTYDSFCLVNDAVYIAKIGWAQKASKIGKWEAVGAQFQHPYVYKKLFTHEPIVFDDYCETKAVSNGGALYLDFSTLENSPYEHDDGQMHFVGKTGRFVPVLDGYNGGNLYRVKDDKQYAVNGTKGWHWLEADMAERLGEECVDKGYFEDLTRKAFEAIDHWGPFADLVGK